MDKSQWCAATAVALVWGWWATRFGADWPSVRLQNRRPTRIGASQTAKCFAIWFAMMFAAASCATALPAPAGMTLEERDAFRLLTMSVTAHVWTVLGVALMLVNDGIRPFELGLHFVRLRRGAFVAVQYVVGWLPAVVLLNGAVRILFPQEQARAHPIERILRDGADPLLAVLAVLAAVVTAPAAEEMLFRGVLQTWLTRRFGRVLGIGLAAAAFGGIHYATWPDPVALIAVGVLFGVVYQKTRSLFCSMLAHSTFNGIMVAVALLTGKPQ